MELKVEKRQAGKSKSLLKKGKVPGIVYSKHTKEPIMIKFDKIEFLKLYEKAGSNTVVNLKGDGIDQMSLIYDWQLDPVKDAVIHVDFLAVKKGEKVKADIPVVVEGEEVLKKNGLKANLIIYEIEIESTPSKIPHEIKVEVSEMEEGDSIHVSDLKFTEGVEVLLDPEQVVLTVYDPEEEAKKAEEREAAREAEMEAAQAEADEEGKNDDDNNEEDQKEKDNEKKS